MKIIEKCYKNITCNNFVQGVEYSVSSFTISDGAFGTCFFFGTGFHGFSYNSNNINRYSSLKVLVVGLFEELPIKRSFSPIIKDFSVGSLQHKRLYSTIPLERKKLSPYWVTGFAEAESSFSLKISKKSTSRSGWHVIPEFRIDLHNRDCAPCECHKKGYFTISRSVNTHMLSPTTGFDCPRT